MFLDIKGVSKTYDGTKKHTLKQIDLQVKKGEFICVVGPSGCGKTTLLNIIAGLILPTEGEIVLNDKKIQGPGADRIVIFQEAALFPWLDVMGNVKFGMKMAKLPKEQQDERAKKYLQMVHLWDFKDYAVHELSGGMKQRTALARALSLDSDILLMDEPFSALDKQTTNMLRSELEGIWQATGKTIFFVTHSVEEAIYFADRVVVLSDNPGQIKEVIPVELKRPRQIDSGEFIKLRADILGRVRKEVEKVAKEEYDK